MSRQGDGSPQTEELRSWRAIVVHYQLRGVQTAMVYFRTPEDCGASLDYYEKIQKQERDHPPPELDRYK
jgi:hypothetical protein